MVACWTNLLDVDNCQIIANKDKDNQFCSNTICNNLYLSLQITLSSGNSKKWDWDYKSLRGDMYGVSKKKVL